MFLWGEKRLMSLSLYFPIILRILPHQSVYNIWEIFWAFFTDKRNIFLNSCYKNMLLAKNLHPRPWMARSILLPYDQCTVRTHAHKHATIIVDCHSSVGLATRYGLDGPEIEFLFGGGGGVAHPSRPPWCPPSLLYNGCRAFPGGKTARAWLWPLTPSIAEVKERVEVSLCLYGFSVSVGFPVSKSECWDGSQHSKLLLHASHVALRT